MEVPWVPLAIRVSPRSSRELEWFVIAAWKIRSFRLSGPCKSTKNSESPSGTALGTVGCSSSQLLPLMLMLLPLLARNGDAGLSGSELGM